MDLPAKIGIWSVWIVARWCYDAIAVSNSVVSSKSVVSAKSIVSAVCVWVCVVCAWIVVRWCCNAVAASMNDWVNDCVGNWNRCSYWNMSASCIVTGIFVADNIRWFWCCWSNGNGEEDGNDLWKSERRMNFYNFFIILIAWILFDLSRRNKNQKLFKLKISTLISTHFDVSDLSKKFLTNLNIFTISFFPFFFD